MTSLLAGSEDVAAPVVDSACAAATAGQLSLDTFNRMVAEAALPACFYREVQERVIAAGVELVDEVDPNVDDDQDDSDDIEGWDGDSFGLFIQRTRHRVLRADEEVALAQRVEAGELAREALAISTGRLDAAGRRELRRRVCDGQAARDEFARHNLRLVIRIATRYQGRGLPLEDLVQEGWIGLAHAIDKFDYRKGFKFSTYATWWIRQTLDRAVDNLGSAIRLPVHAADDLRRLKRTRTELQAAFGRRPTVQETAIAAGVDTATAVRLLTYEWSPRSLDAPLTADGYRLADVLPDASLPDPAEEVERAAEAAWIRQLLNRLDPREADILRYRFGLDRGSHGDPRTLDEVGEFYGLTRERIRQIERQAKTHLLSLLTADREET